MNKMREHILQNQNLLRGNRRKSQRISSLTKCGDVLPSCERFLRIAARSCKAFPRILILTPTSLPLVTGNAMTVEKWRRSLSRIGFPVEVLASQGLDLRILIRTLKQFKPCVIHVHHAYRAGAILLDPLVQSACREIPLVVSPGGTDLNVDWYQRERQETVSQVMRKAQLIVAQSKEFMTRLSKIYTGENRRLIFIQKSICWLGNTPFDLRGVVGCEERNVLFFFPANIRSIKGNLECLHMMAGVHALRPSVRAVFSGEAIDSEYAAEFEKVVRHYSDFASWIPSIFPSAMQSAYAASDVVLNASRSEGLSNALMEATAVGKPLLASRIPGNRYPVLGDGGGRPMGLRYDLENSKDFIKKALVLVDSRDIRTRMGKAGLSRAAGLPSPEEEARQLARVYVMALSQRRRVHGADCLSSTL